MNLYENMNLANPSPLNYCEVQTRVCAVPAAAVVGEAAAAIVIADLFIGKFGGDSMKEIRRNYNGYIKQINNF